MMGGGGRRGKARNLPLSLVRCRKNSPSLKPEPRQFVEAETARGIELAIADLEEHGETDEVDTQILRRVRYTEAQVFATGSRKSRAATPKLND